MKYITVVLLSFLLIACASAPEPIEKVVTVVETVEVEGPEVILPEKPTPIELYVGEPDMQTITAKTMYKYYKASIEAEEAFTDEMKQELIMVLDVITTAQLKHNPFVFIGVSKYEYFKQAKILEDAKRWIKVSVENDNYIRSLKLRHSIKK